jgi:hypothetical protein
MPVIEERTRAVEPPPVDEPLIDPEALIEEARRRQRRRRRLSVFALILASAIAAGTYLAAHVGGDSASTQHAHPPALGATTHPSPIRVILTAQNHQPRASNSPSVHWGYCVKVRTAAGKPPPSRIHLLLEILRGRTLLARVGQVWLNKGYDNWCAGIGGETNALLAVPRGKNLKFQAVVTTMGVTVKQTWPIVVR